MPGPTPAKFTFDLDLQEREEDKRVLSEAALAMLIQNARQDGYAEGFAEGERGAVAARSGAIATAAERLADRARDMLTSVEDAHRQILADATELAASVARKLAAQLMAREPTLELAALINECLSTLEGVPHLVIRCHPDLADTVREIATARMATSGFTGRLIVMGDPDEALGDGRLEWLDGGLVRNMASISAQVDEKISAYLAARGASRAAADQH